MPRTTKAAKATKTTRARKAAPAKSRTKVPVEAAAKVLGIPEGKCLCGCGEARNAGAFRPGHDARLKGRLRNEALTGSAAESRRAIKALDTLGWPAPSAA